MNASKASPKGLVQPHVHYAFLQTASEGLSQNESDSESLAQEIEYQFELQERIHRTEKLVDQDNVDSLEDDDSLEEDSLEEGGEPDADETPSPNGKEDGLNASQEGTADQYSELRYNPNWRNNKDGNSLDELDHSHPKDEEGSPSPSQLQFMLNNNELQDQPQTFPPNFDRESSDSHERATSAKEVSYGLFNKEEVAVRHYRRSPSTHTDRFTSQVKECQHRHGKDFIEKNKLTLGVSNQASNSYLLLHGKKQRENHQRQAHLYKKPGMGTTNSSQDRSLEDNSLSRNPAQHPLEERVELRGNHGRCHNVVEFENAFPDSSSYREVSYLEPDRRPLLHQIFDPDPSVTSHCSSSADNSSWDSPFPIDPSCNVQQRGKPHSMNLAFARNPHQPSSCQNFPGLHSASTGEKEKKETLHAPENPSGPRYQNPYRRTVSEPRSFARHGKRQNFLGHRGLSSTYHSGLQQPINKKASSWDPNQIRTEKTPSNYVSGHSGPFQPPARNLIEAPSPTTQLIQAAEQRHQEISQLADAHLSGNQFASMFPPIIQRGDSDSRLNTESYEESQPVLSRSNSEGYLLQMEKHKERMEKESRKGSRTKGYIKMDVKLGGLGPDYEGIKEKSEKMKQQKEYAKHVNEHNLKNITSTRKTLAKPENKLTMSRRKALEYAKTIPKPKLFVSRPLLEQEPKEERRLARTLNGENLPPIASLESLQNRHEKEKQVVAAFKTLHIV